ncbi:YgiT-type zinc finger protein [Leptospira sp. GIMC2001]|uniref:YgiT-type zinc finger protein n=1 Tax=Leptospira sp. GIMC2001 TaxID=1513297 RepID=UPI00234BCC2A|nr:YgiT-type zinc finger protein [Leptospira sp. GIMC2001]WCL50639.1 YgiT-type zinc finger protein [Leptospira sp. GIMC2001]
MKCIVCHSQSIEPKDIMEEIHSGNDIIYVKLNIPVCSSCGERYYDRKTMKHLEEVQKTVFNGTSNLSEIGKVLVYKD